MRKIWLLVIILTIATGLADCKDLPVSFIVNGKEVQGARWYLVIDKKAKRLNSSNKTIYIPNDLPLNAEILVVYEEKQIAFDLPPENQVRYIEVFFDTRIFNNLANYKLKMKKFTLRYFFKKSYVVLWGNGVGTRIVKNKKKYDFIMPNED